MNAYTRRYINHISKILSGIGVWRVFGELWLLTAFVKWFLSLIYVCVCFIRFSWIHLFILLALYTKERKRKHIFVFRIKKPSAWIFITFLFCVIYYILTIISFPSTIHYFDTIYALKSSLYLYTLYRWTKNK